MGKIWVMFLCVVCISLIACSEELADPDNKAASSKSEQTVEHSLDLDMLNSDEETKQIVVQKGDKVKLVISSLSPRKIHLHGYDIERTVPSNEEIYIEFEANATGRFQITSHELDDSNDHDIESHGELFKSDVLQKGDIFSYEIDGNMDGKTIPYHDHMKHENEGKIIVSLQDGVSGKVQIKVTYEGHSFHPSVVTVKPGAVVSWEVEKDSTVKITSGLPPMDHSSSSHDDGHGDEEILAILEVHP